MRTVRSAFSCFLYMFAAELFSVARQCGQAAFLALHILRRQGLVIVGDGYPGDSIARFHIEPDLRTLRSLLAIRANMCFAVLLFAATSLATGGPHQFEARGWVLN